MKLKLTVFILIQLLFNTSLPVLACTSLAIINKKGDVFHGRTLELAENLPSWLTYYPAGTSFQKKAPDGQDSVYYTARYSILAITSDIFFDGDDHNMMEGINAAGLSFSANMVPSVTLTVLSKNQYKESVPVTAIGEWALANFSNVEQVRQAVNNGYFWAPVLEKMGGITSPFHFAFYDKKGGSIVVEAGDGKYRVYDNPTRVMTNGPDFTWHLQNLNNYTQLTNKDRSTAILGNMKVTQPDSGIATSALPSSDTSVGRFIRAVYYTTYAPRRDNTTASVNELAHIMNNFDRVKNITTDTTGESGITEKSLSEYTVWTTLTDLSGGVLFVRTYDNTNYKRYSLTEYAEKNTPIFIKLGTSE